jgi:hypothetical protein
MYKKNSKDNKNNIIEKNDKKIYDGIINNDFLFNFEKNEKEYFLKYSIKYYNLKKNKIIEEK